MDSDGLLPANWLKMAHQDGEGHTSGENCLVSDTVSGTVEHTATPNGLESSLNLENGASVGAAGVCNGSSVHKEGEEKDPGNSEQAKSQKGPGKSRNAKPSSTKIISVSQVKKVNGRKGSEAVSNGSVAINSQKHSIKSKSLNERTSDASKHPGKSGAALSGGLVESKKLKPLGKGSIDKEEEGQSSSPTAEDEKPRRVSALPNYGFSFKCDERAEKRKEFYTKLEEKIHAKEAEKNNLQAKSKETQEAEIKLFRKSLAFKATPMPSFYQEPPPPKVELKKIPPTRAKSPKLGRRKSSSPADSEGHDNQSSRLSRLSLDEKAVLRSNSTKGISPSHVKRPNRKSLPKLPSEKTNLASTANNEKIAVSTPTDVQNSKPIETNGAAPATEQSAIPRAEISAFDPQMDAELIAEDPQMDAELVAEEALPALVQEPGKLEV